MTHSCAVLGKATHNNESVTQLLRKHYFFALCHMEFGYYFENYIIFLKFFEKGEIIFWKICPEKFNHYTHHFPVLANMLHNHIYF